MESLVLNGKTYVRASKAARDLGYTSDYVGQLCRGGKIDAHLVGRTWYVHIDQLSEHRVEKKRMSRVKAREQAHKSIEEHKKKQAEKTEKKTVSAAYKPDESELIPQVRKLSLISTHEKTSDVSRSDVDEKHYDVENKGKKVVMSGKIKVTDAGDDTLDEDTTVLTPQFVYRTDRDNAEDPEVESEGAIISEIEESVIASPLASGTTPHGPTQGEAVSTQTATETATTITDTERSNTLEDDATENDAPIERATITAGEMSMSAPKTFIDRLYAEQVAVPEMASENAQGPAQEGAETIFTGTTDNSSQAITEMPSVPTVTKSAKNRSLFTIVLKVLVLLLLCSTVMLEVQYRYNAPENGSAPGLETSYSVNPAGVITNIRSKI